MMNQARQITYALLVMGWLGSAQADTRDNAIALFDWAEAAYPELLQPGAPAVQEVAGFYVRHYDITGIYLGVQGDNIWAFGEQLGPEIVYVGKLNELIEVADRDISDAILDNRRAECSYYAESLVSAVRDLKRNILFAGDLRITVDDNKCMFQTNSIPNHDFNDSTAAFATNVSEVAANFEIPLEPAFATQVTELSLSTDNAILLNGVKIDLLAAACYNVAD